MRFRKPLLVGLLALGYLTNVVLLVSLLRGGQFGYDVYAYWAVDLEHLYARTPEALGGFGAFHYAPAVAQLLSVFHVLPWWLFLWAWTALLVATLVWLGGRWWFVLLALPPVILELFAGNINLLLAAATALGFRYPAVWAFVLLTKITPGVGVLWFAVRREWRSLAIALGATVAIVAVSFALAPALWGQWLTALTTLTGQGEGEIPIPLLLRLPVAAAIVAWGALTDRRWAVPVAATVATPVLWIGWFAWPVVLLGALPLLREDRARARRATSAALPGRTADASGPAHEELTPAARPMRDPTGVGT